MLPTPGLPTTPAPAYGLKPEAMLDFDQVQRRINEIKNTFINIERRVEAERRERKFDVSDEALQGLGKMPEGDVLIPMPLISTSIKREQATYITYLTQPNRAAVIKKVGDKNFNTEFLETEFTRLIRYDQWVIPFLKCIDGAQAHGWACIALSMDISKPGHLAFNYVAYEDLIFPLGIKDFQTADYIAIREWLTILELRQLRDATPPVPGLNLDTLEKLIDDLDKSKRPAQELFHFFCKHDGATQHGWLSLDRAQDFMIAPSPLFLGQVNPDQSEVNEVRYPIYPFIYLMTEEKCIDDNRGRAFHDRHKQRAQTLIASGLVNKELRAANVYAAMDGNTQVGAEPRQLDTRLENGAIYDKPLTFFSSPGADQTTLLALQYFDTSHANDTGQANYAVSNRKDARKTATEMESAEKETAQMSMIQVLLFAIFLQDLFTNFFRIARTRGLANLLVFCPAPEPPMPAPGMDPGMGMTPGPGMPPPMPQPNESPGNDPAILGLDYALYPSGDTDVIERQKKIENMKEFWPIVASTPIAPAFLAKLLDYSFPDETFGAQLQQMMAMQMQAQQADQENQLKQLLQAVFTLLETTTTPEELNALDPQQKAQLQQLSQMVKAALAAPPAQPQLMGPQQGGPPQQQTQPQAA